jgi:hypothetical protein
MEWRPVVGYEDRYEVSDAGEVRRKAGFWCRSNRLLTQHLTKTGKGYLRVCLSTRERRNPTKRFVHRLVYEAFRGPIPPGLTINHLNGQTRDNRPENLEVATMREQMIHAYATGLQKPAYGEARGKCAKLTEKAVLEIRRLYAPRKVTHKALAARFGVTSGCVQAVVTRKRWRHI